MLVSQIAGTYATQIQKYSGNSKSVEAEKKNSSKADSVSISKEGAELNKSQSASKSVAARASEAPEIRWDKVDLAKQRMKDGFYDTKEFKTELAEKLAGDFIAEA